MASTQEPSVRIAQIWPATPVNAYNLGAGAGSEFCDHFSRDGVAILQGFGDFLDGRVQLRAQGYQSLELRPEDVFSHDLKATIDLAPGWGGVATAMARNGGSLVNSKPLAGVEVRCDGALVGRTNERGTLVLVLTAPPETVEFRRQGWSVTDRFNFDDDGKLDASGRMRGYLTALLGPVDESLRASAR